MRIETRNGITENEWCHLTQWKEPVFPEEGRSKEWSPVSWHSIAYSEEGEPVAHAGFDCFEILVDSTPRLVIGVGGVVVRPEYQGRGIPRLLFKAVHDHGLLSLGGKVFALFCPVRLVPYYEKHGYVRHQGAIYVLQRGKRVLSSFELMHHGELNSGGLIELQTEPW